MIIVVSIQKKRKIAMKKLLSIICSIKTIDAVFSVACGFPVKQTLQWEIVIIILQRLQYCSFNWTLSTELISKNQKSARFHRRWLFTHSPLLLLLLLCTTVVHTLIFYSKHFNEFFNNVKRNNTRKKNNKPILFVQIRE